MVRKAREHKGWSQRELARRISKSSSYINYVENGRNPASRTDTFQPSIEAVDAIAAALGLNPDEARLAAHYAPENLTLGPPDTLEELLLRLEALGIDQIEFFDAERYRNASPEDLQSLLETIRFAVEYELNKRFIKGGSGSTASNAAETNAV